MEEEAVSGCSTESLLKELFTDPTWQEVGVLKTRLFLNVREIIFYKSSTNYSPFTCNTEQYSEKKNTEGVLNTKGKEIPGCFFNPNQKVHSSHLLPLS